MKILECVSCVSRLRLNKAIPLIILSVAFLIPSFTGDARKKSYRFKTTKETKENPKAASATITDTAPDSTALRIQFPQCLIIPAEQLKSEEKPIFTGFDKKLNAYKESFFIINPTNSDIKGVLLCLTYHTPDGRMLHRRYATINTIIPSGETRNIIIPSWDTQRSFYYLKSEPEPNRGNPFDINLQPVAVIAAISH